MYIEHYLKDRIRLTGTLQPYNVWFMKQII